MKVLLNTQIDRNKWNNLIKKSNTASPFQTPDYYDFFNIVQGFKADVIAIEEHEALICLVVITIQKEKGIKASFSKRGIIYGGFVVNNNNSDGLPILLETINNRYNNQLIYIETRNFNDYAHWTTVFQSKGWDYVPWLNYHLDAIDAAIVKKNMSSSRTRQIKKATNSGAVWKEAETLADVEKFYNILSSLYKEKIKKPLLSWEFFKAFYEQNIGKYLLVYFENKVIGGIMCPILADKTIYEFYVCGLDHEFKEQYPSVLATWAAIDYAIQNKIPLFDFMGAGSPNEGYGVREFKERFGGKQVEHGRFLKIINPTKYNIGKMGLKLISKLSS